MKTNIALVADLVLRVLTCYKENGELEDDYYNNLRLEELTEEDILILKRFVSKFIEED